MIIPQRVSISVQPQASHTLVASAPGKDHDLPVSSGAEIIHHPVAFLIAVHRYRRVQILRNRILHVYCRRNKRNRKGLQFFYAPVMVSSQKDQAFQPFFLYEAHSLSDLVSGNTHIFHVGIVIVTADPLHKYRTHFCKQLIIRAFDDHAYTSGNCLFQVLRAVVGNIIIFLDHFHDLFPRLRINIRVIVDRPGYGADRHIASLCYILDRY